MAHAFCKSMSEIMGEVTNIVVCIEGVVALTAFGADAEVEAAVERSVSLNVVVKKEEVDDRTRGVVENGRVGIGVAVGPRVIVFEVCRVVVGVGRTVVTVLNVSMDVCSAVVACVVMTEMAVVEVVVITGEDEKVVGVVEV